jgi:hypothetical protein
MDIASVTPESISAQQSAATADQYSIRVARKVLDLAAEDGRMLAQMIDSSAGVGQNINTHA